MKCGRARCQTKTDDVYQVGSVTLCRTHRMMQGFTTLAATEKRLKTLADVKATHQAMKSKERETVGTGLTRKAKPRK